MKINWRPYQIACKDAIKKKYDQGITKQLIVQATGTGKRLQAVDITRHFKRTLFLAHREELIMQAWEEIEALFPFQTGIVKGSRFEIDKRIIVASVQTLYNRIDKINPKTFDLVIIDEAHHYVSPTYLKTVRHFEPKLQTAWTATPKRLDGLSLSNIAQEIVFEYRIQDGIREKWLAPIVAYQVSTGTDISKVKRTAGDFNLGELSAKVDTPERNKKIVEKYLQYTPGRQAMAYCVDIDHAYHLKEAFTKAGINCDTVVSDESRCPNRAEIIQDFKDKNITVLTNVNILTEGFDYSDVGAVLMARPTQSEALYVQCIGRGTRLPSEEYIKEFGTDECIILDFVDNSGQLSIVNAYELEKDQPIEERLFLPKEFKDKLLEERERRERRMKEMRGPDRKIDLLRLPEVKPWNSEKMLEPATEKQIKWLRDIGLWQEDVEYTKLQASEIISNRPAAPWMIGWLAQQNYDVRGRVTYGQYQKVKSAFEMKNKFKINN